MQKTVKISALLLMLASGTAYAQVCHNLYPYSAGVVGDNNGRDLEGFIKRNKKDAGQRGAAIDEASGGTWGYVQVSNSRVPSQSVQTVGKERKVMLNFSEHIDATVAMYYTKEGVKATWWARQCNNPTGPLFWKKTDNDSKLDAPNGRYTELTREMDLKKFVVVEYNDSTYNQRDYDQIVKS